MLITRRGIQGPSYTPVVEQFFVPAGSDLRQFVGMDGNICWQSLSAVLAPLDYQI